MSNKPKTIIFYDLETTGVDYRRNCIHQIAGMIEVGGTVVEEFDIRLSPHPKALIDASALEVSSVSLEELQEYPDWKVGFKQFLKIISKYCNRYDKQDKMWLAGYNNRRFDDFFLRKFFELNKDPFFGAWFWPESLDLMVLAGYALMDDRRGMKNFKLKTVCEHLDIQFNEEMAHDALYDIGKTRELYQNLVGIYI